VHQQLRDFDNGHVGHHEPGFIGKYIFSRDHKIIAIQFLLLGLFFLLFGGAMAMVIRWQLAWPFDPEHPVPLLSRMLNWEAGQMPPNFYVMLITMHGTIMIFFAITPIAIGAFGNYAIPLQIGARDMAFPTLNMLSVWTFAIAGVLNLLSFFVEGGAAASGWTAYPPLSALATPGAGQNLWIVSLALVGVSSTMGAINYITTVVKLRAPGMTWGRLSLTVWGLLYTSILNLYFVPAVAVALILLLLDRMLGSSFYLPAGLVVQGSPVGPGGGAVLLYQHLFWFFGHPEVYILILPIWGIVSDLLAVFSRKPAFGYNATVISMGAICAVSGVVWGHHMFTSGMMPLLGKAFMMLTMLVSIPSAVFFLNWLGTLWRGSIQFTTPMLFTLGVVFVFAIGGLTGLFHAAQTVDLYVHDTYFVVAHFHYTLAASVLFGSMAGIYFWFPKMFGRRMSELVGKLHFWLSFIPLNGVFFGMFILGSRGHMRRIADPTTYDFIQPLQPLNVFITWCAFALGTAQLLFVANFVWSLCRGRRAEINPWRANTLEWTLPSPPPHGNFQRIPYIHRGPYEFSSPEADEDWLTQDAEPVAEPSPDHEEEPLEVR
jgi:cytochrome c oxidase subunit 1